MNEWEWRLLDERAPSDAADAAGAVLAVGDTVRLHPGGRGDSLDLFLEGKTATIEAIEQDYDGQRHVAVVLDEDPGRDLGMDRQPGHRFFFRPGEVEAIGRASAESAAARHAPSILVAGIGNIFFGDDGFGVEVIKRLGPVCFPANVKVVDFGIRGFDLASALADGCDLALLVDACPRGAAPGTLHVIEPDLATIESASSDEPGPGPHGLDPVNVIRLARVMGARFGRILVVGCEPETLGDEDGRIGLSASVAAAVDRAVPLVESLVARASKGAPIDMDSVISKEG